MEKSLSWPNDGFVCDFAWGRGGSEATNIFFSGYLMIQSQFRTGIK